MNWKLLKMYIKILKLQWAQEALNYNFTDLLIKDYKTGPEEQHKFASLSDHTHCGILLLKHWVQS